MRFNGGARQRFKSGRIKLINGLWWIKGVGGDFISEGELLINRRLVN